MSRFVKMNYKGDKKYEKQLWKCDECKLMDSESHILWCSAYQHLRTNKSLNNDKDLCQYLNEVLKIREKSENDRTKS